MTTTITAIGLGSVLEVQTGYTQGGLAVRMLLWMILDPKSGRIDVTVAGNSIDSRRLINRQQDHTRIWLGMLSLSLLWLLLLWMMMTIGVV
jgi:hypothetical protein